jgi:hypothetical protein
MNDYTRILHYCWFGGSPLPEYAVASLKTWRELMPDHEIMRWDESNFDIRQCSFVSEAYDAKRWAFVSDYVRFKVVYEYGGTYMDVGSKLLRSISPLERGKGFTARDWESSAVSPGLVLSAKAHCSLLGETLENYERLDFENSFAFMSTHTVNNMFAHVLARYGYVAGIDSLWEHDGFVVYPSEFFCPRLDFGGFRITQNTYSTHLSSASWAPEEEQFRVNFINRWAPRIGDFAARKIARVLKLAKYGSY